MYYRKRCWPDHAYYFMYNSLLFYHYIDQSSMTGLICAASNGHYEITKLLIEKGANLEAVQYVSNAMINICHINHQWIVSVPSFFICLSSVLAFMIHHRRDIDILYDDMMIDDYCSILLWCDLLCYILCCVTLFKMKL